MATGSMKELTKALISAIPNESLPLPDDLLDVIQAYLDKHSPTEDSDSQRLQDELLIIYHKDVKDRPKRYPVFLAILRHLRPAISTSSRILQWWDALVVPVLDHLTEERGLASETREILLGILAYDTDDAEDSENGITSAALGSKLLEIWLRKNANTVEAEPKEKFLEEQVQLILMEFGRKRPKYLLRTLDKYFLKREYRAQVLSLLCEYIRSSPPHLYQVMETQLFVNLLRCLQTDTSTTVVSLAMTALVMFLPHIPNSMSKHLPALFNIYTRILFWDRERVLSQDLQAPLDPEKADSGAEEKVVLAEWEKLTYSFDSDDDTVPELLHYFTFLYGLYPINFMSYIRKPARYLRHANFPGADDIDVEPSEIRERSEPFRHIHLLHQNFYSMTVESELTDLNRWMKSEASDVVAACMSLCGPTYPGLAPLPGPPPTSKLPDIPIRDVQNGDVPIHHTLDRLSFQSGRASSEGQDSDPNWRHTTSTMVASPLLGEPALSRKVSRSSQPAPEPVHQFGADSPTLGPQLILNSRTLVEPSDNQSLKELDQSLPNASVTSLVSNQPARDSSVMDSYLSSLPQQQLNTPSITPSAKDGGTTIASLHREITLLKNDLNFERYLKQQHLSHIGQLRRKHVREATVEAETQNLVNSNKGLKMKLEDAKSATLLMKKESDKSRNHSKKWEAELTTKLRVLKEEQKKWALKSESLRRDLAAANESSHQLRQLVTASEARELSSQQKLESIESNVSELDTLRQEVAKLTANVRTYEGAEIEQERAKKSEEVAMAKVELLEMKLKAREAELERARLATDLEIERLTSRLEKIANEIIKKQPLGYQSMIDSALAVSRTRLVEEQRARSHLLKRYTELQATLLAYQDRTFADEPLLSGGEEYGSGSHSHSQRYSSALPRHVVRSRTRGLSNPDSYDPSGGLTGSGGSGTGTPPIAFTRGGDRGERVDRSRVANALYGLGNTQQGQVARPSSQSDGRVTQRFNTADYGPSHTRSGSDGTVGSTSAGGVGGEGDLGGKVKPGSEVRIYGRGGVQNIGKAQKEKEKVVKKKEEEVKKDKKVGGIRGLRGFQ